MPHGQQQQRHEAVIAIIWHANKLKVHELHQRYMLEK